MIIEKAPTVFSLQLLFSLKCNFVKNQNVKKSSSFFIDKKIRVLNCDINKHSSVIRVAEFFQEGSHKNYFRLPAIL